MISSEPHDRRPPLGALRRAGLVVATILVALAVVTVRLVWEARDALADADAAAQAGDEDEALRRYFDAARLYVPGAGHVERALQRLETLADAAEARGDLDKARRAIEFMRAAALGARSFYTPFADRLPAWEQRLADLYARWEPAHVHPGASHDERRAWHRQRLERRPGPHAGWAALALGGFGLWVSAILLFIWKGVDRSLRLRRGWPVVAGVGFVVGFALFLTGLRLG